MLGMKNHFDISGSIEIHEVDIAGVACMSILLKNVNFDQWLELKPLAHFTAIT